MISFFVSRLLPFLGILISFFVFSFTKTQGYEQYYIIPLIFSIYNLFDKEIYTRALHNVGFAIFFLSACFRFYITPLIACLSGYPILLGMTPISSEFSEAVSLLIYEEIVILLFFIFLKKRFYNKIDYKRKHVEVKPLRQKAWLFVMVALAYLIIITMPIMVSDIHFVGNLDKIDLAETIRLDIPFAGLFKEIVSLGRFFLILLIIDYSYKKYKQTNYAIYIYIPIAAIVLNASFITNLSRFGIIVPIISFTYLMMALYDNRRILITRMMLSLVLTTIVAMSAVKFFSEDRNRGYESNDLEFWGETLQTYFMGVKETAVGIRAEKMINSAYQGQNHLLFLNDSFSNIIGLSNFTEHNLNTLHLYNYVYFPRVLSVSQIPPNIINGLYYFGKFGAPLYPMFFIFLFSFLDSRARQTNNMVYKFAIIYGALFSGLCMMINGAMLFAFLFNDTLIMMLYSKFYSLLFKK